MREKCNNCQKRVLITALGTMNCTTIVKELRKQSENYYIIGADINLPQCIYTSTEVDEYYQFPKATTDREAYFEFVRDFCVEHGVNVYYCVVDEEVETMALHREELLAIGVTLCVANTDAVVICHNKDKFAEWSEQNIPEYCIKRFARYEDVSDDDFPLFVKPNEGRASIGCAKLENRSGLDAYRNSWNDYIVQRFTSGTFIAADVVRCRKTGLTQVCQREELLRNSNGCGVAVRILKNEKVEKACHRIAELLDLDGVVNMEFFVGEEDVKIIEVNPRIPAGVEYSCMAGLNLVSLALAIADGKMIETPSIIRTGAQFAKRYETYEVAPLTEPAKLRLTKFSYLYLNKSLTWLNDPVMRKGMDIQFTVTHDMQAKWFAGLSTRTDYKIWGLECNGVPIGACGFRNIQEKQGELTCYIGEAEYRGKGLAPRMIEQLEQKAIDLGFERITLKVLITNEQAFSLYIKCGFVETQRDEKFIVMQKTL